MSPDGIDLDRDGDTCWTMIRGAAAGDSGHREGFVRRYTPVLRAYLLARWRGSRASAGRSTGPGRPR